jgi:hypothetical protein
MEPYNYNAAIIVAATTMQQESHAEIDTRIFVFTFAFQSSAAYHPDTVDA